MKKILVTGGNGQLGSELKYLCAKTEDHFDFIDKEDLDLCDFEAVHSYFEKHQYDYIINCAAYTAVDHSEKEPSLAHALNAALPGVLAEIANAQGAKLIHISTDFVFDGKQATPLTEEDETAPISVYGSTKLEGEQAVVTKCPKHFILRTSWLYSSYGNNFVKTIMRLAESRDQLGIVYDQVGTPTYARDLAEVLLAIINTDSTAYGLYHYSNEGVASWYDFAMAIAESFGLKTEISPILAVQYPLPAARPAFSVLNKAKICKEFDLKIPHWRKSLEKCKEAMEVN